MGQYETAILNAKAIGNCEVIEKLRQLDFDQLIAEIEDGKHIRADSGR